MAQLNQGGSGASGGGAALDERITRRIAGELGDERFNRYFKRHVCVQASTEEGVRLAVPSAFHAGWLEKRFGSRVRAAAAAEVGPDIAIAWHVDPAYFGSDGEGSELGRTSSDGDGQGGDAGTTGCATGDAREAPGRDGSGKARRGSDAARQKHALRGVLRHDLDDFVVSGASRLAYRAALQIAEPSDTPFTVLTLHGACGVGKTHLLQGVAKRYQQKHPGARVRYVTGETFANGFIAAVQARDGSVDAFRERYRGVDLLCVDDVHFLRGKEATQSEFLHTFEALDLDGARIVLASDEHPRSIRKLHEGIVSRCLSGMVVHLERPDRETRTVIAGRLAAARGLEATDDALALIAEACPGSVREIEGAIKRIEAFSRLMPTPDARPGFVTPALVRRALGEHVSPRAGGVPVRMEDVLAGVCAALHVEASEVMGKGRHRRVVLARALTALLCRELTSHSFPEIARILGRTNHSTVITACQRVRGQIADGQRMEPTPGSPSSGTSTIADVFDRLRAELLRG